MTDFFKFIRGGVRFIESVRRKNKPRNRDRPPYELYAYSAVVRFDDGTFSNTAGFILCDSLDNARRHGARVAVELWDDEIDEIGAEICSVHAHKMTPLILEQLKEEYGFLDKLQLWREQLKDD